MSAATKDSEAPSEASFDDITVERVRTPPQCPTRRIDKVDARLLAIARGELEPDDPFGGLIPIYDDPSDALDVDEGWLSVASAPQTEEAMLDEAVPVLRMPPHELLGLGMSNAAAFLVSQIDGRRSISKLNEACGFDDLESLELVDELLRLGAIDLT